MNSDPLQARRGRRITTPFATIVFAAAMMAVLGGLAALLIWQNYRNAVQAAEARAMSSAQVIAAHLEWMMVASDQALQRIDAALGDAPVSSSINTIADIRNAVGNLPEGFQYSVYDETGRLRYSSVPEAIGIIVSDREYFRRLSGGEQLVISPQLKERLSGEQVFVIARRIDRGGKFHGAASIAIPTRVMDQFWRLLALGPNSTVSVIRSDGWVVARHPQLSETINVSDTPLFTHHLAASPEGYFHNENSSADELPRILGYRKVEGWPLVVAAGIERREAFESFWHSLRDGFVIGLPLIGLLLGGMFWIVRLLQMDGAQREKLEQALERNKFLMREIHHRVKNNLQAVSSLVRLQPLPQERKEDMSRRIAAMVAVHEQIYGADQFEQVNLGPYIERLVRDVAVGFRGHVAIETRIEPLTVGPDQAMPLGLLVNEVVTNAFKHAFAGRTAGRLRVELSVEERTARLLIEDDGPGYAPSERQGMGSRLIDGFVAQLGGTLVMESSPGTRIVVTFPVP